MQPIEWVEKNKGKRIRIVVRTGRVYTGTLVDYDPTSVNMLIDDLYCCETDTKMKLTLFNGATVAYIEKI